MNYHGIFDKIEPVMLCYERYKFFSYFSAFAAFRPRAVVWKSNGLFLIEGRLANLVGGQHGKPVDFVLLSYRILSFIKRIALKKMSARKIWSSHVSWRIQSIIRWLRVWRQLVSSGFCQFLEESQSCANNNKDVWMISTPVVKCLWSQMHTTQWTKQVTKAAIIMYCLGLHGACYIYW